MNLSQLLMSQIYAFLELERAREAESASRDLLASLARREPGSAKDPQVHATWHELGKLYRDKHDYDKATEFFERALESREKRLGNNHPRVSETLVEYAKLLRLKNCPRDAEEMETRALAIREQWA